MSMRCACICMLENPAETPEDPEAEQDVYLLTRCTGRPADEALAKECAARAHTLRCQACLPAARHQWAQAQALEARAGEFDIAEVCWRNGFNIRNVK